MLNKKLKRYLKNKLILCKSIKNQHKQLILLSIIKSTTIKNNLRCYSNIILLFNKTTHTRINDICLKSSVYKKTTKWTNFSRHEYHNLCRTNCLNFRTVNSW